MVNGTIKRAGSLLSTSAVFTAAAVAQEQLEAPPAAADPAVETVVVSGRLKATALDVVEARMEQDVVTDFLGAAAISRACWRVSCGRASRPLTHELPPMPVPGAWVTMAIWRGTSSKKRDGMRSVVLRRSPRGNSSTRASRADASAASKRR